VHSNGYSLVRKLIEVSGADDRTMLAGKTLFDRLLEPTRIYVKSMLKLSAALPVSAYAHITGGGLTDNIPRVLPEGFEARLDRGSWPRDPLFGWLQSAGQISDEEMYRTFNCGIGMVAIVPPTAERQALEVLREHGETAMRIGTIAAGSGGVLIR
jgi:phosphoribosylformylglycinamidine cyclo-ligase